MGRMASSQALQDALEQLDAEALYGSPTQPVHVRTAASGKAHYIDLGDEQWRVVEITAAGWRLVTDPPVRFRRPSGMRALPQPVSGGELTELREFVNIEECDWPLFATWLIAALVPTGPYPVLALHGEQGSAKSTTARVLRDLIDPSSTAAAGRTTE